MRPTKLTHTSEDYLKVKLIKPDSNMLDIKKYRDLTIKKFNSPPDDRDPESLDAYYYKFFDSMRENGLEISTSSIEASFLWHERTLQLIYVLLYQTLPESEVRNSRDFTDSIYITNSVGAQELVTMKKIIQSYVTREKFLPENCFYIIKKLSNLRNGVMHNTICIMFYRRYLIVEFLSTFTELYKYSNDFKKLFDKIDSMPIIKNSSVFIKS